MIKVKRELRIFCLAGIIRWFDFGGFRLNSSAMHPLQTFVKSLFISVSNDARFWLSIKKQVWSANNCGRHRQNCLDPLMYSRKRNGSSIDP